jgi:HK97 family phage portal protein
LKIKLFGLEIRRIKNAVEDCSPWTAYLGGKGYRVDVSTAVKVAAVIRCVDVVSKTIASLPLHLYKSTGAGREKADNHPVYKLLHRLPNPTTTAYEFWHMYMANLMLTRGAYAKIVRDNSAFPTALYNIPTAAVTSGVNAVNGERYIDVHLSDGKTERLREGEFMFTPGLRIASADPVDPIAIAADVLGLTMALNGFAKDYFENGSNIGGVVEVQASMSDTAYERFKKSWAEAYSGIVNQHKVAFLEEGAKYQQLGRTPEDSQALESRKFAVAEICRIFGVPPHKAFDLERATFSNIEHQNIEYVQECITPNAVRLEQTIYKDLLTEREQKKHYAKFSVNGLLRGDVAARAAYYHNGRQDGWLSADDIRELEDMNRLPEGAGGDVYAVNGNLIPLSSVPDNKPKGALK